ncbi:MAG: phosphatidylglycerophosphatase A [Planctomycetes bacterium]|nr:phosphatidylglycerophosphatase A [Planctomycetota bacterium]
MTRRDRLLEAFVTAGYLGYAPRAPGTVGTLGGVAVYLGFRLAGLRDWWWPLGTALVLAVLTTALADWVRDRFGREDPPEVVIDEVAGFLVAAPLYGAAPGVGPAPQGAFGGTPAWGHLASAFVLFRLFDIVKPFPVGAAERVPRAGLVLDDLVAGAMAALLLDVLNRGLA